MTDLGGRGAHPRAVRPARQAADLPPGYPQEYLRLVPLRDGRSVLIRPIQPSDAPALAEAIESADPDTIRRYEGLPKAELSDLLAKRELPKTGNIDELIERLVEADSK